MIFGQNDNRDSIYEMVKLFIYKNPKIEISKKFDEALLKMYTYAERFDKNLRYFRLSRGAEVLNAVVDNCSMKEKKEFEAFLQDYKNNTPEIQNLKNDKKNFDQLQAQENAIKNKANKEINEMSSFNEKTKNDIFLNSSAGYHTLKSISVEKDGKNLYTIELKGKSLEDVKSILETLNFNSKDVQIFENRPYFDQKTQDSPNSNKKIPINESRKKMLLTRIDEAIVNRDSQIKENSTIQGTHVGRELNRKSDQHTPLNSI